MSTEVVTTKEEKPMEYVPFGSQDKIKLTVAIVQNLIAVKTRSGKTCSAADAIKFMMMCSARRLNPFEGDSFLIGYDGKDGPTFSLITAHQAFLKRAEVNPEYDGMKSGIIVEEDGQLKDLEGDFYSKGQKVVGGWATVYFKNRKVPMHKRIRLERFQKSFGIWQEDSAGMICKCAEADAMRSSFPTMLGGLYLREEMLPAETQLKTSAPIFTAPAIEKPEPAVIEEKPKPEIMREAEPEPNGYNKAKAVLGLVQLAGLTEDKVVNFLHEVGVADRKYKTLEEIGAAHPDALELLHDSHQDIFNRIKTTK